MCLGMRWCCERAVCSRLLSQLPVDRLDALRRRPAGWPDSRRLLGRCAHAAAGVLGQQTTFRAI